jgi:hypothetical protein
VSREATAHVKLLEMGPRSLFSQISRSEYAAPFKPKASQLRTCTASTGDLSRRDNHAPELIVRTQMRDTMIQGTCASFKNMGTGFQSHSTYTYTCSRLPPPPCPGPAVTSTPPHCQPTPHPDRIRFPGDWIPPQHHHHQ